MDPSTCPDADASKSSYYLDADFPTSKTCNTVMTSTADSASQTFDFYPKMKLSPDDGGESKVLWEVRPLHTRWHMFNLFNAFFPRLCTSVYMHVHVIVRARDN